MRVSVAPSVSRVRKQLWGYHPLEDGADRRLEVAPATTRPLPPALFLPGQIERVKGVQPFATSLKDELARVHIRTADHPATMAFLCRDVCISHNAAFGRNGYRKLTFGRAGYLPCLVKREIDHAALCSSAAGNDFFAHFLIDDACTYFMARDFAPPIFSSMVQPRSEHCLSYLDRLNIDYAEEPSVFVRNLWIFSDVALNTERCRRLRRMADRIGAGFAPRSAPVGVFIRRGATGGQRTLVNEHEIEDYLVEQGYSVVDPETQSASEICEQIRGAQVVVGVEGSHLVHGLFNLAPGGTILCIQPSDRFNVIFRYFSDALDLNWGFVVAEGTDIAFRLELDDLKRTLELVQKRTNL